MSRPFMKRGLHSNSRKGWYVFGAASGVTRTIWGFPGTSLPKGSKRDKSPSYGYIPVWSEDNSPELPKLFNNSVRTTTRKSTGVITVSKKRTSVLRSATAAQSEIARGTGKFKTFSFPDSSIEDFEWRMPSPYLRSEIACYVKPGTATFAGSNSTNMVEETVEGYPKYARVGMIPNFSKYWSVYGMGPHGMQQIAKSRAIQKVRRNDIELSVALAESRKTFSHLAKTAMTVLKIYSAVKRGDFKTVWRLTSNPNHKLTYRQSREKFFSTKDVSARWLEAQYAWQPLIGDVNGAIKTVLKESRTPMSFKATGSVREDYHGFEEGGTSRDPELHSIAGYRVTKCVLHYAVTDPAKVLLGEYGVNPLLAALEIVPWSFVIDWFLNIGDALQAVDVSLGKDFVSGTITHFNKGFALSKMPIISEQSLPYGYVRTNDGMGYVGTEFMSTRREILTTWPTVSPHFTNPLSTTHVLNAIALARSFRKR